MDDRQCRAFIEYVCDAHSWHRHLSLLDGGQVVIFLADDAGAGYSVDKPRLHHGWKTTDEYRDRYGRLDFQWRLRPDEPYRRDALAPTIAAMPAQTLTLYPYVSTDINATEAIGYARHQADLPFVRRDDRDLILAWDAANRSGDEAECDRVYWELQAREQRKIEAAVQRLCVRPT
jgi:hypothetical protein